ncbi:hypothetical protein CVT26_006691 [Gymnopilus dilepis]|uniref:Uncharacterized protein n=1 Tax=Gymnopilus dilepis TaxID=231916 RepID=A0A409Y2T8_9AGAR|nr:hypothetical protein CVT26_006691 [Gymnopilus dilepis]
MQQEQQEFTKKTGSRKATKTVRYRARHKTLGHLKEEDTKHGFMERIRVKDSESRALEPPRVGVFVMNNATDLQTIPLTQNNYRKALTGKLEDQVRAQPPRRARTLPSSSNTARAPGIGPYSVPRRAQTDARAMQNPRSDQNPRPNHQTTMPANFLHPAPYNTSSIAVPMPPPTRYIDDAEMAYLLESATMMPPIFEASQMAGVIPMAEPPFLTSWGDYNLQNQDLRLPGQGFIPQFEGLPNTFVGNGGASDWHSSHEVVSNFGYGPQQPVASTSSSGPEYMQYASSFSSETGDFRMFDPNMQFLGSPMSYQAPLLDYTDDTFMGFPHEPSLYVQGGTPQQEFEGNMQF